ncbi:MAG TPA: PH domain-containing protein [Eudoraea sp.]|nr:PH domain-containing protein [Eudoraea sp.]
MTTYFPSARSKTLGLFIWGILLIVFGFEFSHVCTNGTLTELMILSSIFMITVLFVGTVWFGTGYSISKESLIVKIGPVTHSRIRISEISKISRTGSIISSPANSLKRLEIRSDHKVLVVISPKEEDDFIKLLLRVNPEILIDLN